MAVALAVIACCLTASAREPRDEAGEIRPRGRPPVPYFVADSGRDGPVVVIVGGVHGDEPAGAAAAGQIRHWAPKRGRIIVIPCANPDARRASSRTTPGTDAETANLNRNFPATPTDDPPRGEQAEAIWQHVSAWRPDWLVDLHEGVEAARAGKGSVGNTIIASPTEDALAAAALMIEAVDATIPEKDLAFLRCGPPVEGSLARAAATRLGARSLIVETTRRGQPVSLRTRQHRIAVDRLLRHLDMLDERHSPDRITPAKRSAGEVYVGLYDGGGAAGRGVPRVLEILGSGQGFHVERVGPPDIRAGVLGQLDIVAFCGGSGSAQSRALGDDGRREVRRFVENGGGYLGICAGAYLACSGFSFGLGILDARTKSPLWRRGEGTVEFAANAEGVARLGLSRAPLKVRYAGGPILEPACEAEVPDYSPLAVFTTEVSENGTPPGIMVGAPAAVAGRFGAGRVLCFSPHPEQTPGLEGCVRRAVRWAAGGDGDHRGE